jgi:hypothetical protein
MSPRMKRPKKLPLLWMACAVALLPACVLGGLGRPAVQNHPQPTLSASTAGFEDTGCSEQNSRLECPPTSPLAAFGCDQLRSTGDLAGGLQPDYPMRMCIVFGPEHLPEREYLYNEGCLMPQFVRYVIWKDGQYRLLRTTADLQQAFGPIDSQTEALSYAIAATCLAARYGLETQSDLRYFVPRLEDTHVAPTSDGYRVHLFDYQFCGCGPHTHFAVDVLVTREGQVQELDRQKIYEDPAEDSLCVD